MAFSDFWRQATINVTRSAVSKARDFFIHQVDILKDKTAKSASWYDVPMPSVGSMYLYAYDPKWKDKLPYYDRLPLVIPIEYYPDGFLGMNFHYLPPMARFKFLQQVIRIGGINDKKQINRYSHLNVNYPLMKAAASSNLFKPTIKRYLYSHVRSSFSLIKPTDWESVVFLPLAKWTKGKPY